jgi:hypothetical protein
LTGEDCSYWQESLGILQGKVFCDFSIASAKYAWIDEASQYLSSEG